MSKNFLAQPTRSIPWGHIKKGTKSDFVYQKYIHSNKDNIYSESTKHSLCKTKSYDINFGDNRQTNDDDDEGTTLEREKWQFWEQNKVQGGRKH